MLFVVVVVDDVVVVVVVGVFFFLLTKVGTAFYAVYDKVFFSFFLSTIRSRTGLRNDGVLVYLEFFGGGVVFFWKHPWSFYGCKVTDWSTVTLPFNFPPGVLACDLEGAHYCFVLIATGETA